MIDQNENLPQTTDICLWYCLVFALIVCGIAMALLIQTEWFEWLGVIFFPLVFAVFGYY